MFTVKQKLCYPGDPTKCNEDIVGFGKNYCFAMDGASCLSGVEVMGRGSDATWLVENMAAGLCQRLDEDDDRPTEEILKDILLPLKAQYLSVLQEKGMEKPDDSPSAGLALFRQRNGKLEFFGLGDCVGVSALPDGTEFYSLDTSLPNLDNQALKQMAQLHRQTGIPFLQTRAMCNDLLLTNRKKRNHSDGYWVLDLDTPEALIQARQFSWELTEPVIVAAFSDGFAQLSDVFGFYEGYFQLFSAMQKTDLEQLFQRLCNAQNADPDCNDFPRFKLRDDTCALWGVFTP